jgi:hypothetical protein
MAVQPRWFLFEVSDSVCQRCSESPRRVSNRQAHVLPTISPVGDRIHLAIASRVQLDQSVVRKRSTGSGYRLALGHDCYADSSPAGFCAHGERQGVCFGFGRDDQRHVHEHHCGEQRGIASYGPGWVSSGAWKCERNRQDSERQLGQSGLQQWRHQCSADDDDQLAFGTVRSA